MEREKSKYVSLTCYEEEEGEENGLFRLENLPLLRHSRPLPRYLLHGVCSFLGWLFRE